MSVRLIRSTRCSKSVSVTLKEWGGWSPGTTNPVDGSQFAGLRFYIHGGGVGGQKLVVMLSKDYGSSWSTKVDISKYMDGGAVAANEWRKVEIPLSALGATNMNINRIAIHDLSGKDQATFYVDSLELFRPAEAPPVPAEPTATPVPEPQPPTATSVPEAPRRSLPPFPRNLLLLLKSRPPQPQRRPLFRSRPRPLP
jgi:hypothetical protein